MYAEIIIPLALPKNYTWAIPTELADGVMIGMRVEVMLGSNKRYAGIIKKILTEKPAGFNPKPILGVLDEAPIVFPAQLDLWEWMASYYMCTEGEVMQAAVPSHLKISSESVFILNEDAAIDSLHLSDTEYIISEALQIKKQLSLVEIQKLLDKKSVYPVINKLIQKGICSVEETMHDKYTIKVENLLHLHADYHSESALEQLMHDWTRAPKQLALLLSFLHLQKTEGQVQQKALLEKSGAAHAQLKALIDKGILVVEKRKIDRLAIDLSLGNTHLHQLSSAQQLAYDAILEQMKTHSVNLLHGITGSGKTQIYAALKFEIGQVNIANKLLQGLDSLVQIMTQYPTTRLMITGHTDNTGSRKINDPLSLSRAKKVQAYLIKKGLAANRTSILGLADTQPIASNETMKGRAQNRRVDLTIQY